VCVERVRRACAWSVCMERVHGAVHGAVHGVRERVRAHGGVRSVCAWREWSVAWHAVCVHGTCVRSVCVEHVCMEVHGDAWRCVDECVHASA